MLEIIILIAIGGLVSFMWFLSSIRSFNGGRPIGARRPTPERIVLCSRARPPMRFDPSSYSTTPVEEEPKLNLTGRAVPPPIAPGHDTKTETETKEDEELNLSHERRPGWTSKP